MTEADLIDRMTCADKIAYANAAAAWRVSAHLLGRKTRSGKRAMRKKRGKTRADAERRPVFDQPETWPPHPYGGEAA